MAKSPDKKIGILIVAYNAANTLASVLDRIPEDFRPQITEVMVSDDHSQDATYLVGLGYQQTSDLPITLIRQPKNLGYGGNQIAGYELAIEQELDIVVLLHGDGQYAPECLPDIVAPLLEGKADAVFGSRMMTKGGALKGGMPYYKFVGNKILTTFENAALGTDLSEFHSGYRAYRVDALKQIPFSKNSKGFNFDTQIIIQLHDAGQRIVEVPIPTYYGDEISYVNGMGYAGAITRDVISYRLQKAGFGDGKRVPIRESYDVKDTFNSSHERVLSMLSSRPKSKILDLGCSGGLVDSRLRNFGHEVVGVDIAEVAGVRGNVDVFVEANLDEGIPAEAGSNFDLVLACDVLEHLRKPSDMLKEIRTCLRLGGSVIMTIPNVVHWYPRFRTLTGTLDYDQRGILDETHLRFFTRRSLLKLIKSEGFEVTSFEATGLPLDILGSPKRWHRWVAGLESMLTGLWPTLFGYQFLLEVTPK